MKCVSITPAVMKPQITKLQNSAWKGAGGKLAHGKPARLLLARGRAGIGAARQQHQHQHDDALAAARPR